MKITNKELIQSYIITAARYDFNVHEKRIIYRLVEMCQCQLEGKELTKDYKLDKTLFGDYIVTLPVSSFLAGEADENYTRVKTALRGLRNKVIEYEDEKIWKPIGIIEKPVLEKRGMVTFELQPEIFEAILNFSKGFRRIELKTAMEFETVYAMRFYELLSGKIDPITYSINNLKIMFQLEGKYKETKDFIRRVVDPAQKELKEKAPFSFTYKPECVGKKVVALTFFPYKIAQNTDTDIEKKQLQKQVSLRWDIDKMVLDYLRQNYFFDDDEIRNNLETFKAACKKLDIMDFLSKKRRAASTKKSPKGWLINAIKKEIENKANGKEK
jgi:plasmid replication initiation protein